MKVLNLWGLESAIGVSCSTLNLGEDFAVCDVYGPYLNRIPLWDSLLNNPLLRGDSVILGGDLNFSIGTKESWGPQVNPNPLSNFF